MAHKTAADEIGYSDTRILGYSVLRCLALSRLALGDVRCAVSGAGVALRLTFAQLRNEGVWEEEGETLGVFGWCGGVGCV
jgi:hypothetical protein